MISGNGYNLYMLLISACHTLTPKNKLTAMNDEEILMSLDVVPIWSSRSIIEKEQYDICLLCVQPPL